jgi:transcriptional regulator with XRE-family HTH domain
MVDLENFYADLGQRIREERIRHGLTQKKLAEKVDLTRTSVTNIELGRQKLLVHTLIEIAAVLDVAPSILLPQESPQESHDSTEEGLESLLQKRPADERKWIQATLDAVGEE